MHAARGTIVLSNRAGRALRKHVADVRLSDVLYCVGSFVARERVYIAFLGADGGQFAVASAVADRDATAMQQALGLPAATPNERAPPAPGDDVVVHARDIALLWPAA